MAVKTGRKPKEAEMAKQARNLGAGAGKATARATTTPVGPMARGGPGMLTQREWGEVFRLGREIAQRAQVDNVARACDLAPEMLTLLVDCARGSGTFEGAPASVRRLAALDVLEIATGKPDSFTWRNNSNTPNEINELPAEGDLRAFVEAGKRALELARQRKGATDAEIVPGDNSQTTAEQTTQQPASQEGDQGAGQDAGQGGESGPA